MSMGMSLALTQPSTTCINLNANSANSKRQSSLASRSSSSVHLQHGFQYYLGCSRLSQRRRMVTVRSSIQPVPPPTPPPVPSSPASSGFPGKGWIAGIMLSLVIPYLTSKWPKWGPLFFLKKDVADQKLQAVEDMVEALEKVADKVEHMADDIGKDLPEGTFKRTAELIEDAAGKVEAVAHFTDAAIDKIQELEDEVESIANQSEQVKASKLEANDAQQA